MFNLVQTRMWIYAAISGMFLSACNTEKRFMEGLDFRVGEPKKYLSYTRSGLYSTIYLYRNNKYIFIDQSLVTQRAEGTWRLNKKSLV
jgi:hypothetical protein